MAELSAPAAAPPVTILFMWRALLAAAAVALVASGDESPGIPPDPAESAICAELAAAQAFPPAPAECPAIDPTAPPPADPHLLRRLHDYARLALRHRVSGLASYYSSVFHGRKTANGEIFRNDEYSAAHLTLPLGTWVEVHARATGRKLRLRVNDRGPYAKKFFLDLSQAAARYLGVDRSRDRYVDVRIIALPGEEPPPEHIDLPDPGEVASASP